MCFIYCDFIFTSFYFITGCVSIRILTYDGAGSKQKKTTTETGATVAYNGTNYTAVTPVVGVLTEHSLYCTHAGAGVSSKIINK